MSGGSRMTGHDATGWAIDVMTAWTDQDDQAFVHERIATYLAEPDGASRLITGLVNLSGLLMSGLEVTTGKAPPEILRAIGSTIARHPQPHSQG